MAATNAEYWRERSENIAARQFAKIEDYIVELEKEYERAKEELQRLINYFYARYATEEGISLAEAKRILDARELKSFKSQVEQFIEMAKDNADGRWTRTLNEMYYRSRISRYDALITQMQHHIEMLDGRFQNDLPSLLDEIYKDAYYSTLFEVHKGVGFGVSFALANAKLIDKVMRYDYKDKLLSEIRTHLLQGFIRGDSVENLSRTIAERMDVSLGRARRIVRTEGSFFTNQAAFDSYKESGVVKRYQFLATLDSRTSDVCQSMDLRVFKLSEKQVGVNFPPLHPNCRSTVVAYFEDEPKLERIARDKKRGTYYVPSDMTYNQWYEKYVAGSR